MILPFFQSSAILYLSCLFFSLKGNIKKNSKFESRILKTWYYFWSLSKDLTIWKILCLGGGLGVFSVFLALREKMVLVLLKKNLLAFFIFLEEFCPFFEIFSFSSKFVHFHLQDSASSR
jgi:hypothetical protein